MKYDVTIGIPVYKSELYIRQTLESALAQKYPSIEFLLIDDAGGDGSLAIIQEIQQTHQRGGAMRVITHDRNMGVSASRNQIIEEAKGDYLYFMDSDDIIAENTISIMMENVRRYGAEIVFGSYEKIEISGIRHVYQYPALLLFEKDSLASFAYRKYAGIQASACNYLVKISILRENQLCFINTNFWEDMVFTYELVTYVSRAVMLPNITYYYCCRENSLSNYQCRTQIDKEEIMQNVKTIEYLKQRTSLLTNKVYYPHRCYVLALTDFYIVCNILKKRRLIVPYVSNSEIKNILAFPVSLKQIIHFRKCLFPNIALYVLSKQPSCLCVCAVWLIGKMRRLL